MNVHIISSKFLKSFDDDSVRRSPFVFTRSKREFRPSKRNLPQHWSRLDRLQYLMNKSY